MSRAGLTWSRHFDAGACLGVVGSLIRARRSQQPCVLGVVCSSWRGGELGAASLVAVECEAVDHERVAEEVEVLAGVADAVGASEPEGALRLRLIDSEPTTCEHRAATRRAR
jgi:hypothetical protein